MGLFDKLRGELVDIVEWLDNGRTTLVWRFPRYHNQIKNGAHLIVRPGQIAAFVHRGVLADLFEPGHYELRSDNLPLLSTLQGWKHGFDSPFKAEVYFVATRQITDLKWGTSNPILLRDAEFGPMRLRAFGTYALKATDPRAVIRELVGADPAFEADEIHELLRSMITEALADVLGHAKIPVLDLASNYQSLAALVRQNVNERIDGQYGLELPQLLIMNLSLPEEVEKALDARTSMNLVRDLDAFQHFQAGQAMTLAAANPSGGGATEGVGLGLGFAMANRLMQTPPPALTAAAYHIAVGDRSTGPFTLSQLAEAIAAGQVRPDTLVWSPGMSEWVAAGKVAQLASLFSPVPPPIPR